MENIGLWADKMVNHFWFCCEKCDQNVEDLKVTMKLLILCVHQVYNVILFCRQNGLDSFTISQVNMNGRRESVTMQRLMSRNQICLVLKRTDRTFKLCKR